MVDDVSMSGKIVEGNIAKDIISILFKPSSIREIVTNRTAVDGVKFFIAVSMLSWFVGAIMDISKFGKEGLLLSVLGYPALDFCFIFAFAALIGYFYSRRGYEADHTKIYTCIFYSSLPALVFFWMNVFEDHIVYWPIWLVGICWSMYLLIKALGLCIDNQYENFKIVVCSYLLFWGGFFIVVIIAAVIGLSLGLSIFEGGDFADELLISILGIFISLLIVTVFSAIKPSKMIGHKTTELGKIFCPKCGADLAEGVKFCASCGARISERGTMKQGKSPWLTIWTSPRATIRRIVDYDPKHLVLVLAMLAGFANALNTTSANNLGDILSIPIILLICAIIGPIFGVIGLYVYGALLKWTGGWIGGQGSSVQIRLLLHGPRFLLFGH